MRLPMEGSGNRRNAAMRAGNVHAGVSMSRPGKRSLVQNGGSADIEVARARRVYSAAADAYFPPSTPVGDSNAKSRIW